MAKKKKIKLISWNVNGLRAAIKKDFFGSLRQLDADVVALQEIKLQEPRMKPKSIKYGIGEPVFDQEGRILELDFDDFIFFNVYFPNGQMSEERLRYKLDFYETFFNYTNEYKKQGRSLIITGDYNTAHNEIDLKNPKANENTSGFLRIERDWLDRIIADGYVDTFRHFNPDTVKYSWWTYRFKARDRNIGWRIDYFFVTRDIVDKNWIQETIINNDIYGSDHCPIGLVLEI
jgi:exodeoxyribonuclease-3